jgi:hypothetical protein
MSDFSGDSSLGDFYPTGLTFDAWFRQWAGRPIRTLGNQRVADKLRVGMSKAEVAALAPSDWKARRAVHPAAWYFEAPDVPAQLELDENGTVTKVNPWPFI